ncbi:alpha/beta fold hydrolase [Frankia sp. AiPs1]|uniref:alpha/beta hydrolase n=1 Tax=Frankia sp. AiPs1 TaxID=573493 RepID=UPI0027E2BD0A|nr:alpha/beta fold hydrolase [Frankia sp. AiPs1]
MIAHGFSCSMAHPALQNVAAGLRKYAGVLVMDLRGHGRSSGSCTFGDREVFDVDAGVGEARRLGYQRVITMGWSMGGAAVLRHAGLAKNRTLSHDLRLRYPPDAVVSVSATSRWFVRDTAPMRRIHWLAEHATGRMVARGALRVRIDARAFVPIPATPVEIVGTIAPMPLLIVHGHRDRYFTLEHPRALAAAAGDTAEMWLVPEFGHAEAGLSRGLLDRIGAHLASLATAGPGRPEETAGGVHGGGAVVRTR